MFDVKDLTSKKRPDTAITQFKNSLNNLVEILMGKEPSYIRCIKPNDYKMSSKLHKFYRLLQLKYIERIFSFYSKVMLTRFQINLTIRLFCIK